MNFAILTESKYFETTYLNVQQIRRYHPESEIFIGDIGLNNEEREKLDCNIIDLSQYASMEEMWKMFMKPVFLTHVELPVCFMDADTVLIKYMDLKPEKDIVITVRESKYGRINAGVFILSDWRLLISWIAKAGNNIYQTQDRLSEQNALNQIAYNYNVKEVPCDIYNYPKIEKGIPDNVVVAHLKSGRYKDHKMIDIVRCSI